jgi:hypothetical protein
MRRVPLSAPRAYGTQIVQRLRRRILHCISTYRQTRKKCYKMLSTKSMSSLHSTWDLLLRIKGGVKRSVLLFCACTRREVVRACSHPPHPQRKWPEEKIFIGLESIRNFNVRAKVVGPTVSPSASRQKVLLATPIRVGHVRQVYSTRNGDPRADKGARIRICGSGNGKGV